MILILYLLLLFLDNRLPSAHTCFNHLLLPDYSTLEIMKEKLIYAMTQSEGFGLR